MTVGAFDLLHAGHARFLAEARVLGDELVVGVASDASRRRLKGEGQPIIAALERAKMLEYLKPVSRTVIFDEDNNLEFLKLLKSLKPLIVYSLESDWSKNGLRKKDEERFIKSYGGRVVKVPKELPYLSSSEMLERVADLKIKQVIDYFIGHLELRPWAGRKDKAQYFNPKASEALLSFTNPNLPRKLLGYIFCGREIRFEKLEDLGRSLREKRKKVIFTAMSADLVHIGHAKFLEKAKSLGDVLVVGLPSNASMRRQKGPGRPIVDEKARAELLCYLKPVDYVVTFPQDTVLECLQELKPDIFQTVKDDWNKGYRKSAEYRAVTSYGGKVVRIEKQAQGVSATRLINKAAGVRIRKIFEECLSTS